MSSSAQTMRAVHLRDGKGNAGALFLGDALRPAPGLGQVLVTIHAFGLNRMDIMQRNGMYPVPKGASEILGVEFAETVAHVGPPPAEDDYGAEAKVCARRSGAGRRAKRSSGSSTGAYAEYIVSTATHLIPKPISLSFVDAASIPEVWLTAYQALTVLGELKAGEHVLIHAAASDVGIAAIQPARLFGAFLSGRELEKVDLGPLLFKCLRIQGTTLRARSVPYQADLVERFARDVVGKLTGAQRHGELKTYVHKVFPLTEIRAAHEEMEGNKNSGKSIMEVH